jgi:dynein heavy chain
MPDEEDEDVMILRSLMNVTQPKFTLSDTILFKSITGDLFPGVELPVSDYS